METIELKRRWSYAVREFIARPNPKTQEEEENAWRDYIDREIYCDLRGTPDQTFEYRDYFYACVKTSTELLAQGYLSQPASIPAGNDISIAIARIIMMHVRNERAYDPDSIDISIKNLEQNIAKLKTDYAESDDPELEHEITIATNSLNILKATREKRAEAKAAAFEMADGILESDEYPTNPDSRKRLYRELCLYTNYCLDTDKYNEVLVNLYSQTDKNANVYCKGKFKSPAEIYAELDKLVYSQEDAKREASLMAFEMMNGRRRNAIFAGPSGCGKTEIFRALQKIYPNVYIYDGSSITEDGWSGGKKFYSVFAEMMSLGFSKSQIEHSIIAIDEFDKLIAPATNSGGENVHAAVQGQMLSMIEGSKVTVADAKNRVIIDTSHISFAFLGAFEDLRDMRMSQKKPVGFGNNGHEDCGPDIPMSAMIKYGLRRELAGRISKVVSLRPFKKEDYINIIKMPVAGIEARIAAEYNLPSFEISDIETEKMAEEAVKNGIGARGLTNAAHRLIDDILFETGEVPERV